MKIVEETLIAKEEDKEEEKKKKNKAKRLYIACCVGQKNLQMKYQIIILLWK